jgi:hypothetical protein
MRRTVRPGPRRRAPRAGAAAVLTGAAAVAAYLAGAAISGHVSPAARRPLLDGFNSAQPYRWVNPPPALAANNQPPHHAAMTFAFKGGVLQGGVVFTNDQQATVIIQDGSIAASSDQTGVRVTVDPVDPAKLGPPPDGQSYDGNAYRILGAYQPGGASLTSLTTAADISLAYPADATFGLGALKHAVLYSPDGKGWQTLGSVDLAPGVLQVTAKLKGFGYVVVGRTGGAAKGSSPFARIVPIVAAGVVVLLILLFTSPRVIRRLRGGRDRDEPNDAS